MSLKNDKLPKSCSKLSAPGIQSENVRRGAANEEVLNGKPQTDKFVIKVSNSRTHMRSFVSSFPVAIYDVDSDDYFIKVSYEFIL